jgi:phosphatidylglycerol:prolipoprotein diacylglycerol transferase
MSIFDYSPSPILSHAFGLPLYWYGFFYVLAIILGYLVVDQILKKIESETSNKLREILPQFTFWIFLWGIIGARFYHVLNEWQFYFENPKLIWRLDNGGLAIHGALISGALYLFWKSKRLFDFESLRLYGFLWLTDLIAPALLLGQAIGRWGNYFNQELYGRPTNLLWGIFISPENRIAGFEMFTHFHPTFFYEFLWNLLGTIILLSTFYFLLSSRYKLKTTHFKLGSGFITALYLIITSSGRIFVETLRIDATPEIAGLRLPLLIAISLTCLGIILITTIFAKRKV